MVVGWYHSHPGFGCWLSGVDINTQQVWLFLTCHVLCLLSNTVTKTALLPEKYALWLLPA